MLRSRLGGILLATALTLIVLPGAATADHLDDEGDRVEFRYVTDDLGVCTGLATNTPHAVTGAYLGPPVVTQGVCLDLAFDSTYELTAVGPSGQPVRFTASVSFPGYGTCQFHHGHGALELTVPPAEETSCNDLDFYVTEGAPLTGTLAVEKIR